MRPTCNCFNFILGEVIGRPFITARSQLATWLLGLLLALCGITNVQAAGYAASITTAYPQLAISTSAPQVVWAAGNSSGYPSAYVSCDDCASQIMSIGFTFSYAGTNYSRWSMSSNGVIFFETNAVGGTSTATASGGSTYTPVALPTNAFGTLGQPALMPFWADLIHNTSAAGANTVPPQAASASFFQYQVLSVSGAQVLVIQLKNVGYWAAPSSPVNMQIQLWSTGQIVYSYGAMQVLASNALLRIGLQYPGGGCSNLANNQSTSLSNQSYLFTWDTAAAACPTVPTVNHYEIREDGAATLCADPVTVLACSSSTSPCPAASIINTQIINAAVTVTGTGSLGTPNISPLSFNLQPTEPTQTVNLTWASGSAGTATLGIQAAVTASGALVCTNLAGTAKFGNCNMTVANTACIAPPHHYEIQGPASGTNCANQTFTIKAWADALQTTAYTAGVATGTLTQSGNPASFPSLGAFSIPAGSSTVTITPVTFPAAGTTTFSTTAVPALAGVTTCNFGGSTACAFPVVSCAPHHLEIQGPASGVTCLANSFTVKAWADAAQSAAYSSAAVTGNITATGTPTVTYPGGSSFSIPAGSSTANVTVGVTTPGSVVLGTSVTSSAPASTSTCNFGSPACTFTATSAGFIYSTTATGGVATLPTQIAGTVSTPYYLRAVQTGASTGACVAALTNPSAVTLGYSCNNPGSCSAGNYLDIVAYNGASAQPVQTVAAAGTSTNLYFDGNGSAPLTLNYRDAGQITLNASKAAGGSLLTALSGSSNAFVVKPGGISITGVMQTAAPQLVNPGAVDYTGAKFVKAGEAFTASISALTSAGAVTPNFGREATPESVMLTPTVVAPAGGSDGALSNALITGFSNGVSTPTNLAWSEVGVLMLTPSVGDGDYLGAGNVTGSAINNVGRFIPDHFEVALLANTSPTTPIGCPGGQLCPTNPAPNVNGFVYANQPFKAQVTAKNVAGVTTTNYKGNFAKTTALSAWNAKGGATVNPGGGAMTNATLANTVFASGVASTTTPSYGTAAPTLLAPTDVYFRATEEAGGDGVTSLLAIAANSVEVGLKIASGRISLPSAYGSERLPLPMTFTVQYFQGSYWVTSATDNAMTFNSALSPAGNLSAAIVLGAAGCATVNAPSATAVVLGVRTLSLAATSAPCSASLSLTGTPAYLPLSPATGGLATFGIFKSPLIYRRENY